MAKEVVDDVFTMYEKLETKYMVKITEENISRLAMLFKGQIDWTGDKPKLRIPRPYNKDEFVDYPIGNWLDNRGMSVPDPNYRDWKPGGSYRMTE